MKKILFLSFFFVFLEFCALGQRQVIDLNGSWNFAPDSMNHGEVQGWFSKGLPADAIAISVPHTWNTMPGLENYWGKGWYEKNLEIPAKMKGRLLRLQFDAVYHDATIWVNGIKAGGHYGVGYTRFFIDITKLIKPGKPNRIVVLADNSASRSSVPFMKSFDWAHDGGMFRGVKLICTPPEYIERVDITATPDVHNSGNGVVELRIYKPSIKNNRVLMHVVIVEENQKTGLVVYDGNINMNRMGTSPFPTRFNIPGIHLWHFDAPNLYLLKLELIVNGKVTDTYSSTFGFRTITFDSGHFILNGEKVRLAGIEWMPGSSLKNGMAETKQEMAENLRLMKGMNCIYTRFHWPQDEYVLDWCDRNGILVQEEIPYWGWETEMNDTTVAIGNRYLDDMIAAHYNHPSIITWGTGNELRGRDAVFINALNELRDYAKSKDHTRLVNYVSNSLGWQKSDSAVLLADATSYGDVMCWNEYTPTWSGLPIEKTLSMLDYIKTEYPGKPLVISEFGLCEPAFPGGDERRIRDMQYQIPTYGSQANISGFIYFCLNDYRTHMGEDHKYSYPQRVHGIVDIKLNKKLSYTALQNLCSPLDIKTVTVDGSQLTVEMRGKIGIPSYIVKGYTIDAGGENILIPDVKPGEEIKVKVPIKAGSRKFTIHRPTGFEVLGMGF
jgi:beta-galactosidase